MIFHQCVKPLNAGFVEISAGFCVSQSRLSRDLHKDVKDLGWNSGMAGAAEHSKLFVRAVLLLQLCFGAVPVPWEPAHLESRRSWASADGEVPLFSGWRLLLSLPTGQIPHEGE